MKISIASSGDIPSQWAHSINLVKHAQGFYDLGHQVKIHTVKRLYEDFMEFKIKDIHRLYGINTKIKIEFFRDNSFFYFNDIIPKTLKFLFKIIDLDILSKNVVDPERRIEKKNQNQIPQLKKIFQKLKTNFYISSNIDPEKKISDTCKRNQIDLCYSRAYRTIYYNIQNKIPSVLETHEAHIWKPHVQLVLKLSNSKYFKGIVTISDILKDEFIEAGMPEEKILVLEDAVDLPRYDSIKRSKANLRELLGLPKNKVIIMYTGRLNKGRGIETIIDAASILGDKNLFFLIIGGYTEEINYWRKYKLKKNNQFNLKFLGFIQNNKIPFYHKAADVLLAPYSSKCITVEWMSPIKIFEYMASKVPIITSDVKRVMEICNNGESLFFKESDPINLAETIEKLVNSENLRYSLIEKAYKTAKNYTYRKRCHKILDFYIT